MSEKLETCIVIYIYANPAFPQLETKKMDNKFYFVPKNSELYLTQLYGVWKIPSGKHADWPNLFYGSLITGPYSKYWDLDFEILDSETKTKNNLNKLFWNDFYKSNNHNINKQSYFAEFIYNTYINKNCKYLLDLGCGNCRDSIFFSNKNIQVDAVDCNGSIKNNYHNLNFIKSDIISFLQLKEKPQKIYDLVYMRWFLHAIPYETGEMIFKLLKKILPKGVKICIEVRSISDKMLIKNSIYDKEDFSYKTSHKRWLYSIPRLEAIMKNNDIKCLYILEGNLSPDKNAETPDPVVIRCVMEI